MSTLIRADVIVPGVPGVVIEHGGVIIRDGRVVAVVELGDVPAVFDGEVIEAAGGLVMPGLVNIHTHGVSPSPLFPSGARALSDERWRANLDRHLAHGTTTVLSTCGLGTMAEIHHADAAHAVHVRGATAHTPSAMAAAIAADGVGLSDAHRAMTIERMLADGAVAIGELAGGQTLGGGGQDLVYLPRAFARETGRVIDQAAARGLKEAVLGRLLDPGHDADPAALADAMRAAGLDDLDDEVVTRIVVETVVPSLSAARDGIREGVAAARRHGVPALVHSAAASASLLRQLMADRAGGATLIAGHVNHTSHTVAEAMDLARLGRDAGWIGEASVFDLLELRHTVPTREHWDALLCEPGLVGVLATDYGHDGAHDPLISAVEDVYRSGTRSLADAVAMATSEPARLIPGLVDGGAVLRAGAPADLVLTRADDLRRIDAVFIGGVQVAGAHAGAEVRA